MIVQVEGVVRHSYSPDRAGGGFSCVCCPGRHRFASRVDGIPNSGSGWIHEQIRNLPDGARVRLTLTVDPAPEHHPMPPPSDECCASGGCEVCQPRAGWTA